MICMLMALPASAQLFRVQCPTSTAEHPLVTPTAANPKGANPAIKCQEVSGADGYATMADGAQIYLFGFGPLSGLELIKAGLPGTQTSAAFNNAYNVPYLQGLDAANGNASVPDPLYEAAKAVAPNGAIADSAEIMKIGVLSAQQPAPLMAIDEDDEFFLTLSNVGMIMRPDLFEQHTIHFHGYPNASPFFDGVPDASVAVNISGSMTYYYQAPDAGTYFWHCHITPPEHLQMGMVGQLYVRPRQNRVQPGADLLGPLIAANQKAPGAVDGKSCSDILCTGQTPAPAAGAVREAAPVMYAYNDGDGSTAYDVEYPIQMMGFDPTFHFAGMTFEPEDFSGMKDKYFMLSGRSYPDTVGGNVDAGGNVVPGPIRTQASDGLARPSQPLPTRIILESCVGQPGACGTRKHRALLRMSDVNVTEFTTLATIGIPMKVIAVNARLLRDLAGNNLSYLTNSVTMGGGESTDVILDAATVPPGTYFLYSTNLDHLSNDAENFGGMMTEIIVN
ncbi:multicopper oxidase domain-containing protein [Pararobbsia alpina]|uniref:Plastocyanin-like domain-containing protein n=1 Tax=Pararobbsia alpina TaxID=621374 RepID=A0A6S7BYM3_9BURK|nr:multicopper oxidase domain-containing protein [Pararobbsia alpina]CAB3803282.1 hypothetical protein LMG28138_05319 [Pararobbsia alpina]